MKNFLQDKIIVITGASRGLGKALAINLASQGARIVVSARTKEELEEVAELTHGTAIVADVSKESDMNELAQKVISQFGGIDIWINNAGIWLPRGPVEEADMKKAHQLFEINFFGSVYGVRAVLPFMKKSGKGMIVNILSTSALSGRPLTAIYAASKYAGRGFTDSLREETKDAGISVVGIYPGGIKTDLFTEEPPEFELFMTPEYVAEKIVSHINVPKPENELVIKRPGQK